MLELPAAKGKWLLRDPHEVQNHPRLSLPQSLKNRNIEGAKVAIQF